LPSAPAADSEDEAPLLARPLGSSTDAGTVASTVQNGATGSQSAEESDDESDDEMPVTAQVAAAAAEAAAEGEQDSASSSEEGADKAARAAEVAAEVAEVAEARAPPGDQAAAADSDSESSDSESSDSSSSSSSSPESESGSEAGESPAVAAEQEMEVEEEGEMVEKVHAENDFQILQKAHLKRDELMKMWHTLPQDTAETAIVRSFIMIVTQAPSKAAVGASKEEGACLLAEVTEIADSMPYSVPMPKGESRQVKIQLRCRRGTSTRLVKISAVSNRDITTSEFEQWRKLMDRTGADMDFHFQQMKAKAQDISAARGFNFDEKAISARLALKKSLEFDAQKESRMRFLVQCAVSHMDISGIRETQATELEARYQDAARKLRQQEVKSAEEQAEWFKMRPNLYSLKEINKKNLMRQVADDRHALMFALEQEEEASKGAKISNPFERRACRPVSAWDTKLSEVEELKKTQKADAPDRPPGDGAAGSTAAEQVTAEPEQAAAPPEVQLSRVDTILQAHRKANLLAKLGSLVTAQ